MIISLIVVILCHFVLLSSLEILSIVHRDVFPYSLLRFPCAHLYRTTAFSGTHPLSPFVRFPSAAGAASSDLTMSQLHTFFDLYNLFIVHLYHLKFSGNSM